MQDRTASTRRQQCADALPCTTAVVNAVLATRRSCQTACDCKFGNVNSGFGAAQAFLSRVQGARRHQGVLEAVSIGIEFLCKYLFQDKNSPRPRPRRG